uniref:MI domain-containing protein n=1 Tax=Heterorhabditis bacteriophora TaxID=37862 RepID=A0A1I7WYD2_HETBA
MERQRSVVDRFVHLLSVGAAIPVLEKISSMFREAHIDASLVRYFTVEIFDRGMQEKVPVAGEFLQHCGQLLPVSQVK